MFIANITLKEVLEAQKRRYSDEAHLNLCRSQKKRVPFRNTGLWITIPKTASPWFVQMGKQREGSHGDLAPHFGAPHHPVHWKCQVCERGEGGDTTKSKQVNRRRKAAESSRWSYCNYTTTTEPLAEDEQVEEEEQVQIVYPVAPRRFPPRDTAFPRPRRTLHVPHYPALPERDYFGTRATWLSEEGYCDASGHAVATSARCEARRVYNDSLDLEATTPSPATKPSSDRLVPGTRSLPSNQSSWQPADYDAVVLKDDSSFSESTWYSSSMSASHGSLASNGDEDESDEEEDGDDDLYEWNAINPDAPDQEWEHLKARVNIQQMDRDARRRLRLGRRIEERDEWDEGGYLVGGGGVGDRHHHGDGIPVELKRIMVEMSGGDYVYAAGHGTRFGEGYGIGSDSTISEWRQNSSSDTSLSPWSNRAPSLLPPLGTHCSVDDLVHPDDSMSRCRSPIDLDIPDTPCIPAPRGSPVARQQAEGSPPTFDFDEVMEEVMDSIWASEGVRWVYPGSESM